jgi:DNA-binding transcriptional ArsR family regulator
MEREEIPDLWMAEKLFFECEDMALDKDIFVRKLSLVRLLANERKNTMRHFLNVVRALGDENRLRVLLALRSRELCVCQIVELLGLAPSTVSQHMSILKRAGLVDTRKSGRLIFYQWPTAATNAEAKGALEWLSSCLSQDTVVTRDERRLKDVLDMDIEMLCAKCKMGRKVAGERQ